jgi:predicted aspartyl protease
MQNIRVHRAALAFGLIVAVVAPCAAQPAGATLHDVLAGYLRAVDDPGTKPVDRVESTGSIAGAGLTGSFHTWEDGEDSRDDESLGPRSETTLRLGDRVYYVNADGNVREFTGIMLRRDRTQRFIDSGDFARAPERCTQRGRAQIDGRSAYAVDVAAPGGESETVYLDAETYLPIRVAYDDDDGRTTVDFSDFRSVSGHRFPFRAVVSNGDHAFDVDQRTDRIAIDGPIDPAVFRRPAPRAIEMAGPQMLALTESGGHIFVDVGISGKTYRFLIDSGAQNILIDEHVAREAGLPAVGALEASGAQRTGGMQLARLDALQIGAGTMHDLVVTVLDLGRSTSGAFRIDGILGYPFFAEAAVTIDAAKATMLFGPPDSFVPLGQKVAIETDRAFPEARFRVNGSIEAPFIVDTGNAAEVLLYKPFVDRHAGIVPPSVTSRRESYGIGGTTNSYASSLDRLEIAGYSLYHADASVMLATQGAFADRVDAGNVGLGVLRNFVVTFDESRNALYIERSSEFDDGRSRV